MFARIFISQIYNCTNLRQDCIMNNKNKEKIYHNLRWILKPSPRMLYCHQHQQVQILLVCQLQMHRPLKWKKKAICLIVFQLHDMIPSLLTRIEWEKNLTEKKMFHIFQRISTSVMTDERLNDWWEIEGGLWFQYVSIFITFSDTWWKFFIFDVAVLFV